MFSAYAISLTIEQLGGKEGRVFGAIMRGYTYTAIADHYKMPIEQVMEVLRRGTDIIWPMRNHPR